ncbi:unnamed protein product [Arabidopsis halleri]
MWPWGGLGGTASDATTYELLDHPLHLRPIEMFL